MAVHSLRIGRFIVTRQALVRCLGLPEDSVVVAVRDTDNCGSIEMKVVSNKFDKVAEDALIPILESPAVTMAAQVSAPWDSENGRRS